MRLTLDPFRLLLIFLAGCLSQQQQDVIDYLREENRVLRDQLGSKRRGPGRPRTQDAIQQLVVRVATANRDWGYRRIQGAPASLGHMVARSTIANLL